MRIRTVTALGVALALVGATVVSPLLPADAGGAQSAAAATGDKELRLWYDEPAPDSNDGWVNRSLPLGNGYMGVNVFGGVAKERLQITENSLMDSTAKNTLTNTTIGGLNSFAEVYLDFAHTSPTNYTRELSLDDAVANVAYDNGGVRYTREYFTSYPDKVLAMKLTASQAGKLSFTLRPTIPYETEYRVEPGDNRGKRGTVKASGDTITLEGRMDYYDIQFEGQFKVIPTNGTMAASQDANGDNGKITVTNADSAIILVAVGTNYESNPQVISTEEPLDKLNGFAHPHAKVTNYIADASAKTYADLLADHQADYRALYDRASLDLGGVEPTVTTDQLIVNYRNGTTNKYLEELSFQYGRYLLVGSSRKGTLPPNLQGVWNMYQDPPWTAGYWHNINLQMNYWPAFNTNLAELFDSYVDYYKTYLPRQQDYADQYVEQYNPSQLDPNGNNGWAFGNSSYPLKGSGKVHHTGFGSGAWNAQMFWDYYDFTRNETLLADTVYPALKGQANFLSRMVQDYDGKLLISPSSTPEQVDANKQGIQSVGTTFDQQMIYENHRNTLKAAEILGKPSDALLEKFEAQMPKLDPITIGKSGQIKEFREEQYYGEIGDPLHRHTSQLLGQYPGQLINSSTPAWNDAVKVVLTKRGTLVNNGWATAERIGHWARAFDGKSAYAEFQRWIKLYAMENLWANIYKNTGTNRVFQIEANFGVTAAMGEMLLQSHEEVLSPLAALPSEWATGSYDGLTARGNFEVSADWANGQATKFEILSKSGTEAKVRYPKLGSAVVKTAAGATVTYTADASGDVITFPTTAGQTYVITSIPTHVKIDPPTGLIVENDLGDAVKLSWKAPTGANAYSVYRAVGDSPTYDKIASKISSTSFTYSDPGLLNTEQVTYRVTAHNADGRESQGTTVVRLLPNLAKGKTATQSSDASGGVAGRAVDGNTNGAWAGGSVSNTASQVEPWWQVDLGGSTRIGRVDVWNRTDSCCSARLADYWVLVSDSPITATSLADAKAQAGVQAFHQTSAPSPESKIPVNTTGRYVRIQLPGTNVLNLAEVEVLPSIENFALGKTATQSTTSSGGDAARAVDGKVDGAWANGSVTNTTSESEPWWQVDLGASKQIGKIAVWNRTDSCCSARLDDYYILVSDSPITGDTLAEATAQTGVTSIHRTTTPNPVSHVAVNASGRYVRIQLAGTDVLNLAEVQVVPAVSNMAVGKPAAQSSTSTGGVAPRAVDGNTNGAWASNSVTHTLSEANPWWQTDLGASRQIGSVKVWNRTDSCCSARLGDYYVLVSDAPITGTLAEALANTAVTSFHQTSAPNPSTSIAVNKPGRYVRVQLAGTDILSLAEVEVLR